MTGPLIHIGFHKTASTLLQQKLFTDGELGFHLPSAGRAGIHDIFVTRVGLDPLPADAIDTLRQEQAQAIKQNGTLAISHERLSGYPASGGFDQGIIAERLHDAFPDGRVVVVIREQRQIICSMYLQTISDGGTLSLKRFLNRPDPMLMRKPGFDFGYYEYDRLITKYRDLFGADNVRIMAYEQFRQNTHVEARNLVEFALGPDAADRLKDGTLSSLVNRTRPLALQAVRRQINKLVRSQLNERGLLPIRHDEFEQAFRRILPLFDILRPLDAPLKTQLQARIDAACMGRYGASNQRVADMTGLDLDALGYEMQTP